MYGILNNLKSGWFLFGLGAKPASTQAYSWLCMQENPLAVLRGPYGVSGIETAQPCSREMP